MCLGFYLTFHLPALLLLVQLAFPKCFSLKPKTVPTSLSFVAHLLEHPDAASQWFFCGGFGTAMIGLAFIGTAHHSLHGTILRWEIRTGVRYIIGTFVILIPLIKLSDFNVMITVTCLYGFVIILEE